jgi:hypothetical protein
LSPFDPFIFQEVSLKKTKKWEWHMVHVRRLAVFGLAAMAMFSAWVASAQCYQFNGMPSSVTLNFKNLPPPRVDGVPGTHVTYSWSVTTNAAATITYPVPGAGVTLIVAGRSYASELRGMEIVSSPATTIFEAVLSVSKLNSGTDVTTRNGPVLLTLKLLGRGNLLPNGILPATFPPISAWTTAIFSGGGLGTNSGTKFTSITSCPG